MCRLVKPIPGDLVPSLGRRFYEKHDLVLVEGLPAIRNALRSGSTPRKVFFTDKGDLESVRSAVKLGDNYFHVVSKQEMEKICSMTRIHSVAALFNRPRLGDVVEARAKRPCIELTLVSDGLQDQQNLGTFIRAAALAGCKKVVCLSGSASVWNQKTVRASSGFYFHVPVVTRCVFDNLWLHIPETSNVYVTHIPLVGTSQQQPGDDHGCQSLPFDSVDWTKRDNVAIVGNESLGVSKMSLDLVASGRAKLINIPQFSRLNCLSATSAATIIAFEALRQTRRRLGGSYSL